MLAIGVLFRNQIFAKHKTSILLLKYALLNSQKKY